MSGQESFSMMDLLRAEVVQQGAGIRDSVAILENALADSDGLEQLGRTVHSLKGAAKLVNAKAIHEIVEALETTLARVTAGEFALTPAFLTIIKRALSQVEQISQLADQEITEYAAQHPGQLAQLIAEIGDTNQLGRPPQQLGGAAPAASAPVLNVDESMLGMFRDELDAHCATIAEALLIIEDTPADARVLEKLMRAAHSIKGAARMIGLGQVVSLAHVMEDIFVAAQHQQLQIDSTAIDILLQANDLIQGLGPVPAKQLADYLAGEGQLFEGLRGQLARVLSGERLTPQARLPSAYAETEPELDPTMLAMFREEVKNHGATISDALLALENDPADGPLLDKLMRAAHSIKGAARMVGVEVVVRLAHVMEDLFVAAQNRQLTLSEQGIDLLLKSHDLIQNIAGLPENQIVSWGGKNSGQLEPLLASLQAVLQGDTLGLAATPVPVRIEEVAAKPAERVSSSEPQRVLKVTADRWDSMMGLASEIKVEAGWVIPYLRNMTHMRKKQYEISTLIDTVRDAISSNPALAELGDKVADAQNRLQEFRHLIADQISDLDNYERRISNLSERLHREALSTRMRPFSDGVHGFQRMVRDISRSLGKKVKMVVKGDITQVDREVLEKIEAPLNHIIRNALDHGIEDHDERLAANKPLQAQLTLSAVHHEGLLQITIGDDGRGIDVERLRQKVVSKGLVSAEMAESLSKEELLEFLFLPSFSTRDQVTDLSGRGVGLDVVMDAVQAMRGTVKIETELGVGTDFILSLPLTLSVLPSLLVKVSGEYFAFPLSRIMRTAKILPEQIEVIEDHQYVKINGENIGLLTAQRVLELPEQEQSRETLSIVIITNHESTYGVVVDEFVGQFELAVQAIDKRLGKIQDISASALLEDGSTVLIIDVEDMVRTIDLLVKGGRLGRLNLDAEFLPKVTHKKVLIVDDSLTVREVEKKILEEAGYRVEVAVDGMDGWNAVRSGRYDLVITDIDMPRMNGIELVSLIKDAKQYRDIPVIIISYKDRQDDRKNGMEAGADYYLTKGSFHDDSFLHAVHDLIGEAV